MVRVQFCVGRLDTSSQAPCSSMRPARSTAMRSAMLPAMHQTTPKWWVMNASCRLPRDFCTAAIRLTQQEQAAIAKTAKGVLPAGSRVLLFGSRADDHRRGGGIDLLVEAFAPVSAQQSMALSTQLAARLYRLMGERRIDILVATADEPDDRLVVSEARRDGSKW